MGNADSLQMSQVSAHFCHSRRCRTTIVCAMASPSRSGVHRCASLHQDWGPGTLSPRTNITPCATPSNATLPLIVSRRGSSRSSGRRLSSTATTNRSGLKLNVLKRNGPGNGHRNCCLSRFAKPAPSLNGWVSDLPLPCVLEHGLVGWPSGGWSRNCWSKPHYENGLFTTSSQSKILINQILVQILSIVTFKSGLD